MKAVIEQLKRERIRQGLSQREFARRVGTSQSAVSGAEKGVIGLRLSTLERWAAALGFAVVLRQVSDAGETP